MQSDTDINYSPLTRLIGVCKGLRGTDVAIEKDGDESNTLYETIDVTAIGTLTNIEEQKLVGIHCCQLVNRLSYDKKIHGQTGFGVWGVVSKTFIHSLTIARAVSVLLLEKRKTTAFLCV